MALIDEQHHWCHRCGGVRVLAPGMECTFCFAARLPPAEGKKHDGGKIRWLCLPWKGLAEVGRVVEHGAEEYGEMNWQKVEPFEKRYGNALLRHITAWAAGETHDPKSGLHHLAHAAWNCLALLSGPKR